MTGEGGGGGQIRILLLVQISSGLNCFAILMGAAVKTHTLLETA
jgi:hypothetical protein